MLWELHLKAFCAMAELHNGYLLLILHCLHKGIDYIEVSIFPQFSTFLHLYLFAGEHSSQKCRFSLYADLAWLFRNADHLQFSRVLNGKSWVNSSFENPINLGVQYGFKYLTLGLQVCTFLAPVPYYAKLSPGTEKMFHSSTFWMIHK